MDARTKIVATLGPASDPPDVLDAMLRAGVDVIRLNLSHGDIDGHLVRLAAVRAAAERTGQVVAVLADLPGPKVRSAPFPSGGVGLVAGDSVLLVPANEASADDEISTATRIVVDYPSLLDDLHAGDRVVLGDGAISLGVERMGAHGAMCRIRTGGHTQGRPGVHIPAERLRLTTPTREDLELAAIMADHDVDFLAVSFVRTAHDLRTVRVALAPRSVRLIAKIETMAAMDALEEIVAEADAVMVARGDLGIDCPLEDVPHLQKQIIRAAVDAGVPVITATQMMESMITAPAPTRAEVSDIANAVFDGTDAVMLSAETAIGHDPALVVRTMGRVAERAEQEASYGQWAARLGREQRRRSWRDSAERITLAITHAASQAAIDAGADAIVCCTRSGRTARAMARYRPSATLIGLSPNPRATNALSLSWGVVPMSMTTSSSTDELIWLAVEETVRAGHVEAGDLVLVLAGAPEKGTGAATDVLRLVRSE
jgi:pyruvate kinase